MTRFGETVRIRLFVKEFNGIRLKIGYEIRDSITEQLRADGWSSHCFLSDAGNPVSVKKTFPQYYDAIKFYLEKETK